MSAAQNTGEWTGVDWKVEVEQDCFDAADGLVVSLYIENKNGRESGLAELSPMEARSIARVLSACADYVERARE